MSGMSLCYKLSEHHQINEVLKFLFGEQKILYLKL